MKDLTQLIRSYETDRRFSSDPRRAAEIARDRRIRYAAERVEREASI